MGRWSQRRRRGGGGVIVVSIHTTLILSAVDADGGASGDVIVTFNGPVTAAAFTASLFSLTAIGDAESVSQEAANSLRYHSGDWAGGGPLSGEPWLYTDAVALIVHPESGNVI